MINRIPHKVRVPLTYMPMSVNLIFIIIFCLIGDIQDPERQIPNFIEFIRLITQSDLVSIMFLKFLFKELPIFLPSFFSAGMMIYTLIQDSNLKRYDKKNGTKLSKSYYDETYEDNVKKGLELSLSVFMLIIVITLFIFMFTNLLPRNWGVFFDMFSLAVMSSLCTFSIAFVIYEISIIKIPDNLKMESAYV